MQQQINEVRNKNRSGLHSELGVLKLTLQPVVLEAATDPVTSCLLSCCLRFMTMAVML